MTQEAEYESLQGDIMVGMGKWGFGPTELRNPLPNNEGSVHIWKATKIGSFLMQ